MFVSILFCNTQGTIIEVHDPSEQWSQAKGQSLVQILGLEEQNIEDLLPNFGPELTCKPPQMHGEKIQVHLVSMPSSLCPQGGYMAYLSTLPNLGLLETKDMATHVPMPPPLDYAVFNAVFNDASDAIILVDHSLQVLAANRKAHRVYAPQQDQPLSNLSFLPLIAPEDRELVLQEINNLAQGASWRGSLTTLNRSGTAIPVKFYMRCLNTQEKPVYQIMLRDLRRHMALEQDLKETRQTVAGMNIALKQVLLNVEDEKQELKEDLVQQVRDQVLPAVDRLVREDSPRVREAFKSALQDKIADLTDVQNDTPVLATILTPREIDVCRLIQQGWQGKAIAEELSIAFETLQTHRKNIRHKLNLTGKGISLSSFLQQHAPL